MPKTGGRLRADRVLLTARAALEAALRRQVAGHVGARDEVEPRVRVRGRDETAAVAMQEELEHGKKALQVGLLVDREVELASVDRAQRRREEVVAARFHTALVEAVLAHHRSDACGRARVDGEESPQARV